MSLVCLKNSRVSSIAGGMLAKGKAEEDERRGLGRRGREKRGF